MGHLKYTNGFRPTLHEHALEIPLGWKKPRNIFVNSMSDLFERSVPDSFIKKVFDVMNQAHWHTFQVLTKRSHRLESLDSVLRGAPNIWMGVTVESADFMHRIDHLRRSNACIKFICFEPLLGPLPNLRLEGIDWVIVGGESGPGSRPMEQAWVLNILNQCLQANVPFFFKQWGGRKKEKSGRLLEGRTWDEMPATHYTNEAKRRA